ncbi:hypothetical protein N0V84_002576 [Fusarium piperis]|uniref:C2H2-type domain-containing protein n=1 Tax=Fusarium piperis TaxID=1435070 RepID=A0A9W8WJ18_9HYPO|nr:hypothetical protein N0V84_002576 [Fusarium piperis]
MKRCSYCHRTFIKTEHLLRHERSHTGEKPYQCRKCNRRYARRSVHAVNWTSDVLLRHVKYFHGQDNASNDTQSNPESAPEQNQDQRRGSSAENEAEKSRDGSNGLVNQGDKLGQDLPAIDTTAPVDHLITSELDALAAATLLQARNQGLSGDSAFAITHHSLERPQENHPDPLPEPAATQDLVVPDLTTSPPEMMNGSTDFHVMLSGGTEFVQSSLMINNGFNDLEACQGVLDFFHGSFNTLDFMNLSAANGNSPTLTSSQFASTERAGSIPLERFAQVARLWPGSRSRLADDGAARIWIEVLGYRGDNILTDIFISETSPTPSIGKEKESKWGLDEDKRQELVHEFVPDALSSTKFPPTRLLNLGLDIVFRQPHSLLPFIHRPTFSAKSAPNLVVLSLCLLGLVHFDSRQVREFAFSFLPAATQKCCHQLATPSFGPGSSVRLIAHLTSAAVLLMAWSICPPVDTQNEVLARLLYSQTISVAQLSGLFNASPDSPSLGGLVEQLRIQNEAQGQLRNDDALWKAWARAESVKRLISTLIMTDAWWAYTLGDKPLIRCPAMQFEVPCSVELFQASSARSWRRVVDSGTGIVSGTVMIQTHEPSVHLPESQNLSPVGIIGLLSIIWIRILEVRIRVAKVPSATGGYRLSDASNRVFASDETGRGLSGLLNEIYGAYSRFLRYKNPNCIVMWHFLNINLFANLEVFELAAGRKGADGAHEALQNIAAWSQTWYARRACLHAAGVYTAMSRRRISDGTMFHSEISIFAAALVLGLYVFMMPPNQQDSQLADVEPYEFLNEVDWPLLWGNGMEATSTPQSTADDGQENAARRFLREGGVISFSGVICEGGYNAAKMILLEFASLIEEVGKWNAGGLCHILRIMSDSLLDVEDQPEGG